MSKPIRVATICHNEDDLNNPSHRRVRLELRREADGRYVWWCAATEEDCNLGSYSSVQASEIAALQAWGADVWDFRAKWVGKR